MSTAVAQCDAEWSNDFGLPGADFAVRASVEWDPDGAGPMSPLLVVGGQFHRAGTLDTDGVAAYDPATRRWTELGGGLPYSQVECLAVLPNGELVAGGNLTPGSPHHVMRWDGSSWSPLGGGIDAVVYDLTVAPNGDRYAGGDFLTAGAGFAPGVARWDGLDWYPLGTGVEAAGEVHGVAVTPNGDVYVAGTFLTAGGAPANRVARWDGVAWSPLSGGVAGTYDYVDAVVALPNGDVCIGGYFTDVDGMSTEHFARWDGGAWHAYQVPGTVQHVYDLDLDANGDVLLVGRILSNTQSRVLRWIGSGFLSLGGTSNGVNVYSVDAHDDGTICIGGSFSGVSGRDTRNLGLWDGVEWHPPGGEGSISPCDAVAIGPGGEVVVGGQFGSIGEADSDAVAAWNGSGWSTMGLGVRLGPDPGQVHAIARMPGGDYIVGGEFDTAGGAPASNIARWDGSSWSPLGAGCDGPVNALHVLPSGDLVVGGEFTMAGGSFALSIAGWDGSGWIYYGVGFHSGARVHDLTHLPNGDLLAGGFLQSSGATPLDHVARWNGAAWNAVGAIPQNEVQALTVLPSGDIIAGADAVHRWDGASWTELGNLVPASFNAEGIKSLLTLPTGELLAASDGMQDLFTFTYGSMLLWDGTAWSPFEGSGAGGDVRALALADDGTVWAAGDFIKFGADYTYNVARLDVPCPATAAPYGVGCTGPAGALSLTATTLPWVGTDIVVTANGLAPTSLGIGILSFGQLAPVPLTTLPVPHPGVGCTLDVATLDVFELMTPLGSSAPSLTVPLPLNHLVAGTPLYAQAVELDTITPGFATFTTNAIELHVGGY